MVLSHLGALFFLKFFFYLGRFFKSGGDCKENGVLIIRNSGFAAGAGPPAVSTICGFFQIFPRLYFFQDLGNYFSPGIDFDQIKHIFGNFIEKKVTMYLSECSNSFSSASRAQFKIQKP